jgi:hypothetical protein
VIRKGRRGARRLIPQTFAGRLTRSLPLSRSHELPVCVARVPAAPFRETPGGINWRLTQTPYKRMRGKHSKNFCDQTAATTADRVLPGLSKSRLIIAEITGAPHEEVLDKVVE